MTKNKNVPKLRFLGFEGEWGIKKLGECVIKIGSGSTPTGGSSVYLTSGIPFIRSQNVNDDRLDTSNISYISDALNLQMKGSIVKPFDVLLNITGASIGRSCVVSKEFSIGNVNQHVCIIRLAKSYSSNFLQSFLVSFRGQKLVAQGQVGSGREGLNFQSIRSFKIHFPSLPEQQKIASFLTALDTKINQVGEQITHTQAYKQGLLQQMFV